MRRVAEEQDDENHADVHGEVDHRDIELPLNMGRMLDSHARPEVQVHGFAQYGEGSADECLARNDCRTRGHVVSFKLREKHFIGGACIGVGRVCSVKVLVAVESIGGSQSALLLLMEDGLDVDVTRACEIEIHTGTGKFFRQHRHIEAVGIEAGNVAALEAVGELVGNLPERRFIGHVLIINVMDG